MHPLNSQGIYIYIYIITVEVGHVAALFGWLCDRASLSHSWTPDTQYTLYASMTCQLLSAVSIRLRTVVSLRVNQKRQRGGCW